MGVRLLLATNNPGKTREYLHLLAGTGFELTTLADAGITTVVEETGDTMEENARLKAAALAAETGLLSLADDSGLEVDALGGAPGPMSSGYGGAGISDRDRINYLLSQLAGVPWERRSARFRCVIALAAPSGEMAMCDGECSGFIAFQPRGDFGFGYDPVFYLPGLGMTMAELPLEKKNQVSHRARAASKARHLLARPPFALSLK